jgi:hypothetical protein
MTVLASKGSAALRKVLNQYGGLNGLGNLTAWMNGRNIQSCNYTAEMVGDAIGTGGLASANKYGLSEAKKVDAIAALLTKPNMLYLATTPDHHFIVFPADESNVYRLQGFQGSYTLIDWLKYQGSGVMGRQEFVAALRELVGNNVNLRQNAAARLFSLGAPNAARDAASAPLKLQVETDVRNWYAPPCSFVMIGHRAL